MRGRRVILSYLAAFGPLRAFGIPPKASRTSPCTTRRSAFLSCLPFLATLSPAAPLPSWAEEFATSAGRKGCTTASDPSKTIVTCFGELANLTASEVRLNGIAPTENGASTSAVKTPSRYAPPWSYLTETSDPEKAWTSLKDVLQDYATIVDEVNKGEAFRYLHAVTPTTTPPGLSPSGEGGTDNGPGLDDLEFLLRPRDNLVLYRSASRTAVFVYPLTQPVGDGGTNLARLEKIRDRLGWQKLE